MNYLFVSCRFLLIVFFVGACPCFTDSEYLLSEPAIVACIAIASLPNTKTDWVGLVKNYDNIREKIEAIFSAFENFNIVNVSGDGSKRVARAFKIIPYNIPQGCIAAYFPETNVLVPLDSIADKSHTPASKFIIVRLEKAPDP